MKQVTVIVYDSYRNNKAVAMVTDSENDLILTKEIEYPCATTKNEIVELIDADLLNQDHSFDLVLIGGRPPRRR